MFKNIIGQDKAINILKNAIKSDRIAQAYIFYGPEGVGKLMTALIFAKALNCLDINVELRPCNICSSCKKTDLFIHPDVKFYFPIPNFDLDEYGYVRLKQSQEKDPEKNIDWVSYQSYLKAKINTPWKNHVFSDKVNAIRIEQIRGLQKDILMSKYEGRKKIYIIEGFDSITRQASNAFLKTLEEPPLDTHFILLLNNIEKLLPTIISRCIKIEFHAIPTDKIENFFLDTMQVEPIKAKLFSHLSNGSMEKAIQLYHDENLDTMEMTIKFLKIVIAEDDIAFLDWMENNFKKGVKNVDLFKNFIQYLCLWVNDLQMYQLFTQSQRDDIIVFVNQTELLRQYTLKNKYFIELLPNLILELNDFLLKHAGNVNQKIILSMVYQSFKKVFN